MVGGRGSVGDRRVRNRRLRRGRRLSGGGCGGRLGTEAALGLEKRRKARAIDGTDGTRKLEDEWTIGGFANNNARRAMPE